MLRYTQLFRSAQRVWSSTLPKTSSYSAPRSQADIEAEKKRKKKRDEEWHRQANNMALYDAMDCIPYTYKPRTKEPEHKPEPEPDTTTPKGWRPEQNRDSTDSWFSGWGDSWDCDGGCDGGGGD